MTNTAKTTQRNNDKAQLQAIFAVMFFGFFVYYIWFSGPGNELGRNLEGRLEGFIFSNQEIRPARSILGEDIEVYDKICLFLDDDSFPYVAERAFQKEHGKHSGTEEDDYNAILTLSSSKTGTIKTYIFDNIYIKPKAERFFLQFEEEYHRSGCVSYQHAYFKVHSRLPTHYISLVELK